MRRRTVFVGFAVAQVVVLGVQIVLGVVLVVWPHRSALG
jgi:hypothetical protein